MLPQWQLEILRPIVGFFSRVLWKIEFYGLENVPSDGGLIIAANHQTYIDPFWISVPIKRPTRYLAWSDAFRWPVVGRCLVWFGAWPLALEGSDPGAIRRSLQWLRDGGAVVIFPEGGRSRSGRVDLDAAAYGVGRVVKAVPGCLVLCVYLRGAGQASWSDFPRRGERFRVEVALHEPKTDTAGLRGSREIARGILARLAEMEARVLARD